MLLIELMIQPSRQDGSLDTQRSDRTIGVCTLPSCRKVSFGLLLRVCYSITRPCEMVVVTVVVVLIRVVVVVVHPPCPRTRNAMTGVPLYFILIYL